MIPRLPHILNTTTTSARWLDSNLALYVHIPFCRTRCTYCAFNTYIGQNQWIGAYINALIREIRLVGGSARFPVDNVYFGGGTPSLLAPEQIADVLQTCADVFLLAPDTEITLEANPTTIEPNALYKLQQIGVNRLSIGMQSAHDSELRLFGRQHRLEHVYAAVSMARRAGFHNINLDLIYGVPQQSLEMWQKSVKTAIDMGPDHVSLYSLDIEKHTPLQRQIAAGRLPFPDPDLAADMYEWAADTLAVHGFEQYEISNWAKPGAACRHNVHVWRGSPYLGLGAGAHGCAQHTRYANVDPPTAYIERIMAQTTSLPFPLSAAVETTEHLDAPARMAETLILGLRLTQEGIVPDEFQARFGRALWDVYGEALNKLIAYGLLEQAPNSSIRLTRRGRLLGNRVFMEFI